MDRIDQTSSQVDQTPLSFWRRVVYGGSRLVDSATRAGCRTADRCRIRFCRCPFQGSSTGEYPVQKNTQYFSLNQLLPDSLKANPLAMGRHFVWWHSDVVLSISLFVLIPIIYANVKFDLSGAGICSSAMVGLVFVILFDWLPLVFAPIVLFIHVTVIRSSTILVGEIQRFPELQDIEFALDPTFIQKSKSNLIDKFVWLSVCLGIFTLFARYYSSTAFANGYRSGVLLDNGLNSIETSDDTIRQIVICEDNLIIEDDSDSQSNSSDNSPSPSPSSRCSDQNRRPSQTVTFCLPPNNNTSTSPLPLNNAAALNSGLGSSDDLNIRPTNVSWGRIALRTPVDLTYSIAAKSGRWSRGRNPQPNDISDSPSSSSQTNPINQQHLPNLLTSSKPLPDSQLPLWMVHCINHSAVPRPRLRVRFALLAPILWLIHCLILIPLERFSDVDIWNQYNIFHHVGILLINASFFAQNVQILTEANGWVSDTYRRLYDTSSVGIPLFNNINIPLGRDDLMHSSFDGSSAKDMPWSQINNNNQNEPHDDVNVVSGNNRDGIPPVDSHRRYALKADKHDGWNEYIDDLKHLVVEQINDVNYENAQGLPNPHQRKLFAKVVGANDSDIETSTPPLSSHTQPHTHHTQNLPTMSQNLPTMSQTMSQTALATTPLPIGGRAKNVLIIVLESFTGAFFGPATDYLGYQKNGIEPNLPKMVEFLSQNGGLVIPNYIMQTYQTIRGLYGTFCGNWDTLDASTTKAAGFLANPNHPNALKCLPNVLKKEGYSTHFLQGADLTFMNKRNIMPKMGFDAVLGDPEIPTTNEISFDWGKTDKAFFQGVEWYYDNKIANNKMVSNSGGGTSPKESEGSENGWLLGALTVGTHYPYAFTNWERLSLNMRGVNLMGESMRRTDEDLVDLLDRLKAKGVLDDTLVLLVSDESHGRYLSNSRKKTVHQSDYWGYAVVLAPELSEMPLDEPIPSGFQRMENDPKIIIHQEIFTQHDVQKTVLDYLGKETGGMIGRSMFRSYVDTDPRRPIISYTRNKRHIWDSGVLCSCGMYCNCFKQDNMMCPRNQKEKISVPPSSSYARDLESLFKLISVEGREDPYNVHYVFETGLAPPAVLTSKRPNQYQDNLVGSQYMTFPAGSRATVKLTVTGIERNAADLEEQFPIKLLLVKHEALLESHLSPVLGGLHVGETKTWEFDLRFVKTTKDVDINLLCRAPGSLKVENYEIIVTRDKDKSPVNPLVEFTSVTSSLRGDLTAETNKKTKNKHAKHLREEGLVYH